MKRGLALAIIASLSVLAANEAVWAFKILPPSAPMQAYPAPVEPLRCPIKATLQAPLKKNRLTSNRPSPLRPPQDVRRPPVSR